MGAQDRARIRRNSGSLPGDSKVSAEQIQQMSCWSPTLETKAQAHPPIHSAQNIQAVLPLCTFWPNLENYEVPSEKHEKNAPHLLLRGRGLRMAGSFHSQTQPHGMEFLMVGGRQ